MFIQICFTFISSMIWREVRLNCDAPFSISWTPTRTNQVDDLELITTTAQAKKSFN